MLKKCNTPAKRLTKSYKVGATNNLNDLFKLYDEWSQYESDLMHVGAMGPVGIPAMMYKHVNPKAKILEVGCGPGNIGRFLNLLKFKKIYGIDGSKQMVKRANKTGYFKKVYNGIVNADNKLPVKNIDAIIGVGVFTVGHFPAGTMKNCFDQLKSGGYICFNSPQKVLDTIYKEDLKYIKKHSTLVDVSEWALQAAFSEVGHRFPARCYLYQKEARIV